MKSEPPLPQKEFPRFLIGPATIQGFLNDLQIRFANRFKPSQYFLLAMARVHRSVWRKFRTSARDIIERVVSCGQCHLRASPTESAGGKVRTFDAIAAVVHTGFERVFRGAPG